MNQRNTFSPDTPSLALGAEPQQVGLVELITWIGESKWLIAAVTVVAAIAAVAYALTVTPVFTARTSLLPPSAQQQGGSAAALAALGSLGGLGDIAMPSKGPSADLYLSLLKSDSVLYNLDRRFKLKERFEVKNDEALRRVFPRYVRALVDKKSSVINLEVDDTDPTFAADLANAQVEEVTRLLGRLAVSEAQKRRVFFDQQLKETKENLIKAELDLQRVQEKSGVIVLDKQSEALITNAARVRAMITEREVQLRVLRTGTTDRNADVIRLQAEISAMRAELARMESKQGASTGAIDIPVGRLPQASIDYVRARRELKLQETLLEGMTRQSEMAKLDEAREGPLLQQIDRAVPPDYKSKPSRALIVIIATALALLGSTAWVLGRRFAGLSGAPDGAAAAARRAMRNAWRLRR